MKMEHVFIIIFSFVNNEPKHRYTSSPFLLSHTYILLDVIFRRNLRFNLNCLYKASWLWWPILQWLHNNNKLRHK